MKQEPNPNDDKELEIFVEWLYSEGHVPFSMSAAEMKGQWKAREKLTKFLESKTSYGLGYSLGCVRSVEIPSELLLEILGYNDI